MRKIVFIHEGKRMTSDEFLNYIDEHKNDAKNTENTDIVNVKKKGNKYDRIVTYIEEQDVYESLQRLNNPFLQGLIVKENSVITLETIKRADFTAILRVASLKNKKGEYMYNNLVSSLQKNVNLRPLPIKLFTHNALTNEKTPVVMFDHQIGAIEHIRNREKLVGVQSNVELYGLRGSIVKLEMGLGKTLTAIATSLISPRPAYDTLHGENGFPTLIVASKTVMMMWRRDGFEKFFMPNVKVLYYHSTFMPMKAINSICREDIVKYDFVVTSYDMVCTAAKEGELWREACEIGDEHTLMKGKVVYIMERARHQADDATTKGKHILFHTPWERAVFDESQRFANPKTFIFKAIMSIYAKYKLCLTGTPMRNYDTDIWAQLRVCGYTGIMRAADWKKRGTSLMRLHNLNAAILSVDYKDTLITLPPKVFHDIPIALEGTEKTVYELVIGITRTVYGEMMVGRAMFACVLALFTRLRQLCVAPYLITAESKREKLRGAALKSDEQAMLQLSKLVNSPYWNWVKNKDGTAGINSAKMTAIGNILKSVPKGKKILVFSMFTSCLDLLKYKMDKETNGEYNIAQLDGDTKSHERDAIMSQFDTDPNLQALFMTYKVGSEGLNFTAACYVICIEPWWTFAVPKQAIARAWRPGQKFDVHVYDVHCKGSVEDRVLEICNEKKDMIDTFLEGAEPVKKAGGLNKFALGRILNIYR